MVLLTLNCLLLWHVSVNTQHIPHVMSKVSTSEVSCNLVILGEAHHLIHNGNHTASPATAGAKIIWVAPFRRRMRSCKKPALCQMCSWAPFYHHSGGYHENILGKVGVPDDLIFQSFVESLLQLCTPRNKILNAFQYSAPVGASRTHVHESYVETCIFILLVP